MRHANAPAAQRVVNYSMSAKNYGCQWWWGGGIYSCELFLLHNIWAARAACIPWHIWIMFYPSVINYTKQHVLVDMLCGALQFDDVVLTLLRATRLIKSVCVCVCFCLDNEQNYLFNIINNKIYTHMSLKVQQSNNIRYWCDDYHNNLYEWAYIYGWLNINVIYMYLRRI